MMETLTHCPLCASNDIELFLNTQDYSVSHGTFKIDRCKNCNFIFTNPRPNEFEIGKYYDSESYQSHHNESKSLLNKLYSWARTIAVKGKIDLVKQYDSYPEKFVIDIGCGTGFFLQECVKHDWRVAGTEPDKDARNIASKHSNVAIVPTIFDDTLTDRKFTTITMWHVLEHVHRLHETIEWIHQHLKDNGVLIVAVPNVNSYDAHKYKSTWAALDVPRHLYHFTRETIHNLMNKHQFQIESIKPMWFDSYYVSMLSTKYKTGRIKWFDTFIAGTISNLKGYASHHNNLNTSSLIYILKKK